MTGRVIPKIAALACVGALGISAPALAQSSPVTNVYGGDQGEVLGNFGGGNGDVVPPAQTGPGVSVTPNTPVAIERGSSPAPAAGSTLPFTGLEVGFVALAGLLLAGTGVAMRRMVRIPA